MSSATLEKSAMHLNLDRSSWKLVRFGDVAIKQNESVDRETTELKRYIAGEHMHSEDLHLREWGEVGENYLGPAFTRKFVEGDILYGSRRTYLKKVAVAHFDGITANTTFVIKANEELIVKELLPFVMLSEGFTQHSIRNSKGSVNPYINWKDIANYEFLLPPKDQQAKLAELLWAADTEIESKKSVAAKMAAHHESLRNSLVLEGIRDDKVKSETLRREVSSKFLVTTIGDLFSEGFIESIQDGNHGEKHPKSSQYVTNGIPFIMANSLVDGQINFEKSKQLPKEITDGLRIGFAKPRDVLLSHKGTIGGTAIVPDQIDFPYLMLTPQVTYYRCNSKKLIPEFLFQVFNSAYFQNQLTAMSAQSTRSYIGITSQRRLKLAFSEDLKTQKEIVETLSKSASVVGNIKQCISALERLLKSLINQIF